MATYRPILLLLAFACCFSNVHSENGRKELRTKVANQDNIIQLEHPMQLNRIDPSRVIQLSWRPRVFLYRGFLSDEECDHLISLGDKEESLQNVSGSRKVDKSKLLDSIEARIEERISAWTFLPKENSEPLQFLHLGLEDANGKYDYFGNQSMLAPNETLLATLVLYLSDVSEGGQILFPESELDDSGLKHRIWSDCRKNSLVLRPTKGNAILFFNSHLNASPDLSSLHARCPVLEGEMWCATKFFHLRAINGEKGPRQVEDGDCNDEDDNCPRWAAVGECQKNAVFMIGSPDYYGTCRKSCNAC